MSRIKNALSAGVAVLTSFSIFFFLLTVFAAALEILEASHGKSIPPVTNAFSLMGIASVAVAVGVWVGVWGLNGRTK